MGRVPEHSARSIDIQTASIHFCLIIDYFPRDFDVNFLILSN